jgi:transposase-like protein
VGIKRKQHSAEFKARVAMASLSGEKTLTELSAEFGVHPPMISGWKQELVYRKLLRVEAPNLVARNRLVHRMLVDGVNVEYTRADGSIAGAQALIASDGVQARIGALGAGKEWFKPWRTISGRQDAASSIPELQVVLAGVFEPRRFFDLVRHFIVFEHLGGGALAKKIAGYHQFHAVNVAVEETLRAANIAPEAEEAAGTYFARHSPGGEPGDKRVGVVWPDPGFGQEPDDGLLRRAADPSPRDGKPDHCRDHRPRRPGRPTIHDIRSLPRSAAARAGTSPKPLGFAREITRWLGRHRVYDNSEIHAGRKGRSAPGAVGAPQYCCDRR